jgi:hypothetical protein
MPNGLPLPSWSSACRLIWTLPLPIMVWACASDTARTSASDAAANDSVSGLAAIDVPPAPVIPFWRER